jgi:dTDP-4-dehydrorhamnose 3,5-epimerase
MIEGVTVTRLSQILDERGKIMHMLRCSDSHFVSFGEIYFSCIHPGVIKAWHLHKRMVLNYAVPLGNIKFVLYDGRDTSPTRGQVQEIFLGPDNYCLVTVPPLVWNGFKGIGTATAIVANCASIPHDPGEIERLSPFDSQIPYDWSLVHR